MNIKTFLTILALTANCAYAQLKTASTPEWKMTLKVVDDAGNPVSGATANIYYQMSNSFTGLTDFSGTFAASHKDKSFGLGIFVTKDGYYANRQKYDMGFAYQYDQAKWNPTIEVRLKKTIKPIPMYAKALNVGLPVFDTPAGFDLEIGDWVSPYGKGADTDIIFIAHREKRAENDSDYQLKVSFPKAGDGIQEFSAQQFYLSSQGSALKSAQAAPVNGYQSQWIQTKTRRPGKPMDSNWSELHNYYFRVRTVLDSQGKVVSACYGKIYGDFMQFRYYFNPTANDRDVEFDPTKNLVKNLKPLEAVKEP